MPLSDRENWRRNASLEGHEWIPSGAYVSLASWREEPEEFERVCREHPTIFPDFSGRPAGWDTQHERRRWQDPWGCQWEAEIDGLEGVVLGSPLADWEDFRTWTPPEPPELTDADRRAFRQQKDAGQVAVGQLDHGLLFLRLQYLRGFDNFMADIATQDPRLDELIAVVERYNEKRVRGYVDAGIDLLDGGDDLGTQTNSILGPKHFRRYLLPTYQRLFAIARQAGAHVHLHHDGYVMDIADEIVATGATIVNPQDLVNGIDAIAANFKGRVCVNLDVDRQKILPFGSPRDVRELIKEEVMKLGSPAGGLQFIAGIYPPTPARNVEALCEAFEEFRTYWTRRQAANTPHATDGRKSP